MSPMNAAAFVRNRKRKTLSQRQSNKKIETTEDQNAAIRKMPYNLRPRKKIKNKLTRNVK